MVSFRLFMASIKNLAALSLSFRYSLVSAGISFCFSILLYLGLRFREGNPQSLSTTSYLSLFLSNMTSGIKRAALSVLKERPGLGSKLAISFIASLIVSTGAFSFLAINSNFFFSKQGRYLFII